MPGSTTTLFSKYFNITISNYFPTHAEKIIADLILKAGGRKPISKMSAKELAEKIRQHENFQQASEFERYQILDIVLKRLYNKFVCVSQSNCEKIKRIFNNESEQSDVVTNSTVKENLSPNQAGKSEPTFDIATRFKTLELAKQLSNEINNAIGRMNSERLISIHITTAINHQKSVSTEEKPFLVEAILQALTEKEIPYAEQMIWSALRLKKPEVESKPATPRP